MILDSKNVIIFTDGSSRGNPGPGGWGAVIVYNDSELKVKSLKLKVVELGGREEHTTNNRMELQAAIEALIYCSRYQLPATSYQLFSDSSYLINGITKWVYGWQKNGWKTKTKQPVENQDLWQKLLDLTTIYRSKIEWKLISGHVGVVGNERCDEIATAFADNLKPRLYDGPLEKYPIKNILDVSLDISREKDKKNNKVRSRAKAYSYISLVDGVIKTHKTWAQCEARVKGKPARYKKAVSSEEEISIIKSFREL